MALLDRRELLRHLSMAGMAGALGWPRLGLAAATGHEQDWQWLVGNWDVWHERLRERLVGSTTWDEFAGKSSLWLTLGGLGTLDDNLLYLPSGTYRAIGLRAFDPASRQWAIWWLDGRMSRLDPPVRGGFDGSEGEFQGTDVHEDTPVTVRFRWHDIHGKRPHWDQAFSTDAGANWEINWRNYFTRTNASATPIPLDANEKAPPEARDWAFLVGEWRMNTRRRLADGSWAKVGGTLLDRSVMGGLANVGDHVFDAPGGAYRSMSVRAWDAGAKLWRTWWLDARNPREMTPSLTGRFEKELGTFTGQEVQGGKTVQVRGLWHTANRDAPHFEKFVSRDGDRWELDWVAELERVRA